MTEDKDSAEKTSIAEISSEDRYRLVEKIEEGLRLEYWEAEDLTLSRKVRIIFLKTDSGDQLSREFLLHSRYIGQLRHPGLLPVYDMGVHGNRYFFSYRPPPSVSLADQITTGKLPGLFRRSRGYRLRLLQRVLETVEYLHQNGVFLSNLTMNDIALGQHGEVVLLDLAGLRMAKRQRSGQFLADREWIRQDLRKLACLGLNLVFYTRPVSSNFAGKWHSMARTLPEDLRMILDRAFLEMPEPYPAVHEFGRDLGLHLEGYPMANRKGDLLALLHSFCRRNPVLSTALFLLFVIGLGAAGTIMYNLSQQGRDLKKLEDIQLAIESQNEELERQMREKEALAQRERVASEMLFKKLNLEEQLEKEARKKLGQITLKLNEQQAMVKDTRTQTNSLAKDINELEASIKGRLDEDELAASKHEEQVLKMTRAIEAAERENGPITEALFRSLQSGPEQRQAALGSLLQHIGADEGWLR
ncbi:MAG: hypothetical protein HQL31_06890, partial [Planctomycetes bacterium]|nr:hypothetical protein [Planctomycetota bacterium]